MKHKSSSSVPAQRVDKESLVTSTQRLSSSQRGSRTNSINSPKAATSSTAQKRNKSRASSSKANSNLLHHQQSLQQHFYAAGKGHEFGGGRGGLNSLFSPVLSNMHRGGGVQVRKQQQT